MAAAADSTDTGVRKRRVDSSKTEEKHADTSDGRGAKDSKHEEKKEESFQSLHTGSYWLTRIVLLRSVAFIYCK